MIESKETLTGNIISKQTISGIANAKETKILPTLEDISITPTKGQQVFTHENSDGYNNVTVEPIPDEYIIPNLQDKEVTPTKETQNITSDEGYDGLNEVTVNAIPDNYIEPSGALEITENGTYDVKQYEEVTTNIAGAGKYAPKYISFYNYKGTDLTYEIENLDTSNLTSMGSMFYGCSNITSLDLSDFDTSKVTSMVNMFQNCSNLVSVDLSSFDASNLTVIYNMFYGCSSLKSVDLSSFNNSKVKNIQTLFQNCSSLTTVKLGTFTAVTSATAMFTGCSSLNHLDARGIPFSQISSYGAMFQNVPANCEIIVKDETERTKLLKIRGDFTNIKTVAEL